MVYVLDKYGHPLMPTERYGKVRRLLKGSNAKVIKRCPFTIQLMYESTTHTQDVSLGVDAGSKHIGISATTETKELYAADVVLRTDIVELISTRREARRTRRNRKTRYRKPRFNNRTRPDGWLAPSIRTKVDTHLKVVEDVCKVLPITKIIVETASFDIQKIKNPDISGTDYQHGELLNFWNIREYVFFRDNHTCQCCKGKSGDKILNVHHKVSRKISGNKPEDLVTLCETCHTGYHKGTVKLPDTIKKGTSFRDAAFMGIMRWTFYNKLKEIYPNVSLTYGYITKNTRIENHLPKEHYVDARCISGNPMVEPIGYFFYQKKVRCHNRQIHKFKINKGGTRKRNQMPYIVKGFRLFDKVKYDGKEYFIFGRRTSGFFDIRDLQGNKVNKGSISCKKIKYLYTLNNYLTERRLTGSV